MDSVHHADPIYFIGSPVFPFGIYKLDIGIYRVWSIKINKKESSIKCSSVKYQVYFISVRYGCIRSIFYFTNYVKTCYSCIFSQNVHLKRKLLITDYFIIVVKITN